MGRGKEEWRLKILLNENGKAEITEMGLVFLGEQVENGTACPVRMG